MDDFDGEYTNDDLENGNDGIDYSGDNSSGKSLQEYKDDFDKAKNKYNEYKNKRQSNNPSGSSSNNGLSNNSTNQTLRNKPSSMSNSATNEAAKHGAQEATKKGTQEAAKKGAEEVAKNASKQVANNAARTAASNAATSGAATATTTTAGTPIWVIILIIFLVMVLVNILIPHHISDTSNGDLGTLVQKREEIYGHSLLEFTFDEINDVVYKTIEGSACYRDLVYNAGYGDGVYESILISGQDLTDKEASEVTVVALDQMKEYLMAPKNNFNKINWNKTVLNAGYAYAQQSSFNTYEEYQNDIGNFRATSSSMSSSKINNDSISTETGLAFPEFNSLFNGNNNMTEESFKKGIIDMVEPYLQSWIIPYAILVDTGDPEFVKERVMGDDMVSKIKIDVFGLARLTKQTSIYYYRKVKATEIKRYYTLDVNGNRHYIEDREESRELEGNFNTKDITSFGEKVQSDYEEVETLTTTEPVTGEGYEAMVYTPIRFENGKVVYKVVKLTRITQVASVDTGGINHSIAPINYELEELVSSEYYSDDTPEGHEIGVPEYRDRKFLGTITKVMDKKDQIYRQVLIDYEPLEEVALDENGNKMISSVDVTRTVNPTYTVVPQLVDVESFYNVIKTGYKINPINESTDPVERTDSGITSRGLNGNTTLRQVITERWDETLETTGPSVVKEYSVTYYTEEQMKNLGRKISRLEWAQDIGVSGVGSTISDELGENYTNQQFIEFIAEYAVQDMKETGILASVTIAQAALESGYGRSTLASTYNNLFGIKADESWTGAVIEMETSEEDSSGNTYTTLANWRTYDTVLESMNDHSKFLWENRNYKACTDIVKNNIRNSSGHYDYRQVIQIIKDNGYATDSQYVEKIVSVIETYNLWQYDEDPNATWDGQPPTFEDDGSIVIEDPNSDQMSTEYKQKLCKLYPGKTRIEKFNTSWLNQVYGRYTYDDLAIAFDEIDQYLDSTNSVAGEGSTNYEVLPEGGFAWPLQINANNPESAYIRLFSGKSVASGNVVHTGIDIQNGNVQTTNDKGLVVGEFVVATHSGKVTHVDPVPSSPDEVNTIKGSIEIETEDGKYRTKYERLNEINVKEGDTVTKGQVIGRVGNCGPKSDQHPDGLYLHYVMYSDGIAVDPCIYYNIAEVATDTVINYGELNVEQISDIPTGYKYNSSKSSIGGNGTIVDIARANLGNTLADMKAKDRYNIFSYDHWCAMFASWVLREAGVSSDLIPTFTACQAAIHKHFIPDGTYKPGPKAGGNYMPKPGDLVFYDWDGVGNSISTIDHVEIVVEVDGTTITTIGGNTGDGGYMATKVSEHTYDYNSGYFAGFVEVPVS